MKTFQISDAHLGISRDMLLKERNDTMLDAYYNYMVNISVFFGAKREIAEVECSKVLDFEIELANVSKCIQSIKTVNCFISNRYHLPKNYVVILKQSTIR